MLEEKIFIAALDLRDSAERTAYLDQACGGDPALRARIEALLRSHDGAGNFLAQPALADTTGAFADAPVLSCRETAGAFVGPYKLLEQIGEGGMGVVWMAEQQEPVRRKVALKLIKAGMDSAQIVARFEAERQALALMDHPNIAKVLDAGATSTGRPYFVMELVKGVSITKYCDEHRLTPRERLELFLPVCKAVQHAHQKGIVHRDLKPSNIFVARYDGKPMPKVIDFGIAKAMGQQLTERTIITGHGGIVGTLEYMSPEQSEFNALDIDTRSDVYSLGVVLYELLTGTTPITPAQVKSAAFMEILRLIREQEPPRPSTRLAEAKTTKSIAALRSSNPGRLTKELRGELDWIVMKALEKERGRRYDTATALARDIERFLADETVEACPPSAQYRLQKFVSKHRRFIATGASFAALLIVATMVSLSLAVWALIAESDAITARDAAIEARKEIEKQRDRAVSAEGLAQKRLVDVLAEKERADQETAVAKAVNDFLQHDLLGQADVAHQAADEHGRDPEVKVRTLLDRAARAIGRKFAKQPVTEAAIRQTLGDTYLALGRLGEAQAQLERSVELNTTHRGLHHERTLSGRNSLAVMLRMQGKHAKAEAVFKDLLAECVAHLGPDHPQTLTVKHNLTRLYKFQGRYDRAESLCNDLLQESTARLGADHPATLSGKHTLALLLQNKGQYDQAEVIYNESLKTLIAKVGADHPKVLSTRSDLASLHKARGNLDLAEEMHQDVLKSYTAVLGVDHPATLTAKNNLALVWSAQRKYANAERLLQETLETQKAKLGERHPDTSTTKSNLAGVYQAQKKYAQAETLFQEALEAHILELGADHMTTLICQNNLAGLYYTQGNFERAEPLFADALERQRAMLGPDHLRTTITANNLAGVYFGQKKYAKAEPLFVDVLRVRKAQLGVNDPGTQTIINNLAGTYVLQSKFASAEPLLRDMLAYRQAREAPDSNGVIDALSKLGNCLLKSEKYAEAERFLRECHSLRVKNQPNAWNVFNTQAQIGGALLGQKQYAEAETMLLQGYEGMKKREAQMPPGSRIFLTEAIERLVLLYERTSQPEKAAPLRKALPMKKPSIP